MLPKSLVNSSRSLSLSGAQSLSSSGGGSSGWLLRHSVGSARRRSLSARANRGLEQSPIAVIDHARTGGRRGLLHRRSRCGGGEGGGGQRNLAKLGDHGAGLV